MKIFKIITLSISLLFIFGCDDIEEPFIQETNSECGDASLPIPIKQVLIEEFTGHKCGYCPRGDDAVELLKELYCDHVIPVSIHTGIFAEVNSSGKYTYDYRTEDGAAISEYFGPTEFPSAVINRKTHNGSLILGETYWLTAVNDMLEEKPLVDFEINTMYTSGSRNLEVQVDMIFLEAMNAELMLSLYFVEDSII
ncbi:MAG: hypothetical protein C0597_13855, partial [Marinilabiliales bacterium]